MRPSCAAAGSGSDSSRSRFAALCTRKAVSQQHAATAELLSSYVFLLRDRKHAAKLREDMQFLVNDPPQGQLSKLFFVHPQERLDRAPERAVVQ